MSNRPVVEKFGIISEQEDGALVFANFKISGSGLSHETMMLVAVADRIAAELADHKADIEKRLTLLCAPEDSDEVHRLRMQRDEIIAFAKTTPVHPTVQTMLDDMNGEIEG